MNRKEQRKISMAEYYSSTIKTIQISSDVILKSHRITEKLHNKIGLPSAQHFA